MAKLVGLVLGLVVFAIWMNIVGNPHVVETAIGVVLALVAGFWAWYEISKFAKKRGSGAPPT